MRKDTVKQRVENIDRAVYTDQSDQKNPPKNRVIPVTVMIYYIYGEPWSS